MKYFAIIVVLYVSVESGSVKNGLVPTYGSDYAKTCLGPVDYKGTGSDTSTSCCESSDFQYEVNEEAVTNSSYLVYPCSVEDYDCIRSFLANNSMCTASNKSVAEPFYLKQLTGLLTYPNMTYTATNCTLNGLSQMKVADFYYNNKTGNVVLYLVLPQLNITSPKVYLTYLRKGKEPIVLADSVSSVVDDVYYTVVIPKLPNLRLDMANIHGDMGLESNTIGANAYTSTDSDVTTQFNIFKLNLEIAQRESVVFKSQLFPAIFIQSYLCDFGVTLYSV